MVQDYFHLTVRKSVGLLIPVTETVEVVTCQRQEICPIPGVVPPLRGVLNQRGRLLWVVGLGDLLKLPTSTEKKRPQDQLTIVILSQQTEGNIRLGGVVSRLQGIVSLSESAINPVPSNFRSEARQFLAGVTPMEGKKAALLDVANIFQHLQAVSISTYSSL